MKALGRDAVQEGAGRERDPAIPRGVGETLHSSHILSPL